MRVFTIFFIQYRIPRTQMISRKTRVAIVTNTIAKKNYLISLMVLEIETIDEFSCFIYFLRKCIAII